MGGLVVLLHIADAWDGLVWSCHVSELLYLSPFLTELQSQLDHSSAELKDERQECKKLKADLQHCQDDLAESRSEKERFEKILAEFKQRARAKKSEWDEEMEELRQTHELEMQQLKDRYRKEKSSSNAAVSDQLSQVQLLNGGGVLHFVW